MDALVFAGGIGEGSARLREEVARKVACLGFKLDQGKNADMGKTKGDLVVDIGEQGTKHKVLVCKTDEQFEMARMCAQKADLWK